nr:uncharacterized protein LOC127310437 [Lolium perenne]
MAEFPCPRINEVLPPVAPAVVISTTVAPTVGHGTSGLRAAARPYSPIRRPIASDRMIATCNFFHIQLSSYQPASSPLAHAWMVPVGTVNLFVGLASISDPSEARPGPLHDPFALGQLLTATRPLSSSAHAEGESALEDDADSAAAVSVAGSITAASMEDSITPVSHPSNFEDKSILPFFDSELETDSVDAPRYQYPIAIFMAGGDEVPPNDAFSMPLPATTNATEIEAHRAALEEQRKKELAERQKFRLEQDEVRAVSHYRQERNHLRMERALAQGFPSARHNFDDPDGEVRVAQVQNHGVPESSRAAAGRVAHGAPPPPRPPPPPPPLRPKLPARRSTLTAYSFTRRQSTTLRLHRPFSLDSLKRE